MAEEEIAYDPDVLRRAMESLEARVDSPLGKKFGDREVVEGPARFKKDPDDGRLGQFTYKWLVRCKCGDEQWLTAPNLEDTKQCRRCFDNLGGDGMARMLSRAMTGAISRDLTFEITEDDIRSLFYAQGCRCKLSGMEIVVAPRSADETTASLDRIDSKRGYELDNIQWVHKDVNMLKGSRTDEQLIRLCRLVADHSRANEPRLDTGGPSLHGNGRVTGGGGWNPTCG